MVLSDRIKRVQDQSEFLLWVATVGDGKVCELTRVSGFVVDDDDHITFFLPVGLFPIIKSYLKEGSKVSFLMASIMDFESYQVKGVYESHQFCSEENVEFYRLKVLRVIDILSGMGMDGNGVLSFLLEQPSVAVTMRCTEMYEQTPKPGTGEKITD